MTTAQLQRKIFVALKSIPEGENVLHVRLFGSRLRGEERPDSDYDFLVEVEPTPSAFGLLDIKHALEDELDAKVDLLTPGGIHPVLKKEILSTAKTVYEK